MTAPFESVGDGILAIDADYVRPRLAASHLLTAGGRAAFIDVGANHSAPNLLAALASCQLGADDVEHIILTHVHLDHAGGAGQLARLLPRARVWVHPRGAAHLIDPAKLIAGTMALYGAERYAELYGELEPIAKERISTVADGQQLTLGDRTLEFIYTPGHALHHVCIVDRDAHVAFTGDTFGISYREFDGAAGEFAFPTTTPTQFDPEQLLASIDRVLQLKPRAAYLTHYSRVTSIERLGADLKNDIAAFVAIAREAARTPKRVARIKAAMFDYLSERLDGHGYRGGERLRHQLLDGDIELNAAGLDTWLSRTAR